MHHDNRKLRTTDERCFYRILRVHPTASVTEIKQAYHREARSHHPDKKRSSVDNDEKFLRIQEAWECLGDPQKRAAYDEKLRKQQYAGQRRMRNAILLNISDCRLNEETEEAFYQCRCGLDMAVTSLPALQDDLVTCPGCSLIYDTAPLFDL